MPNEQPFPNWSDWQKPQRIVELCGIGLVWYQKYLQSLIFLNGILSLISLIPIGAHAFAGSLPFNASGQNDDPASNSTSPTSSSSPSSPSAVETSNGFASFIFLVTTASYPPSLHVYLYVYMALVFVGLMTHFLLYKRFLKVEYIQGQSTRITSEAIYSGDLKMNQDHMFESPVDLELLHVGPDLWQTSTYHKMKLSTSSSKHHPASLQTWIQIRADPQDDHLSSGGTQLHQPQTSLSEVLKKSDEWAWFKRWRNSLSILCFALVLAAYGVSLWLLQTYLYSYFNAEHVNLTLHIWISVLLGVIQALTDLLWLGVCEMLRYLEVHQSDEIGRKWQCVRLFLLRVFSINVFYLVRTYVLQDELQCSAELLGIQHVIIIISYVFGDLWGDFAWPWLYRAWKRCGRHYERDYDTWYEFDLSEQYSAIAFRHMLLCCGASFMPGLSVIAFIGHYTQLKCDQYRLCHLTALKGKVQSSYHKFLVLQGVTTLFTFLFLFPKGVVWLFIYPDSFFTCDLLATA